MIWSGNIVGKNFGIAPYQHQKFLKLNSDLVQTFGTILTQEALTTHPNRLPIFG